MKKFLLLVVLLSSFKSEAFVRPDASEHLAQNCRSNQNCDLMLFQEILKLYRPSKEEKLAGDFVWALKTMAENFIWKTPLWGQRDRMGNIIIRLPATGRFRLNPRAESFALQSHMDMVLAYADAKPGEDIRKYFVNGVAWEVVDGWIQSKGKKTTLGADNGIGMAYSLRYLLDSRIEHPPLELIFTVQEEIGLVGAMGLEIPIISKRMLCLDGMTPEPGMVIVGSQGGMGGRIKGSFSGEMMPADSLKVQVELRSLRGGHSGGQIHLKILNAMKGLADLYATLLVRIPGLRIQSLIVGDEEVYNKIPSLFSVVFVLPKSQVPTDLKAMIQTRIKQVVDSLPDENKNYQLEIKADFLRLAEPVPSLEQSKAMIQGVLDAPNGVLAIGPEFPNGVKTSSNLSFWTMGPVKGFANEIGLNLGYLDRSFSLGDLKEVNNRVGLALLNPIKSFGVFKFDNPSNLVPWIAPSNSPLLAKVLSLKDIFQKKFLLAGGLEPSVFTVKYPRLDVLALGPMNQGAHSASERLEIASIGRISKAIEKVVQAQY